MKICKCCNKEKSLEEFSKNSRKSDGLQIYCKECVSKKNKDLYSRSEKRRMSIRERAKESKNLATEFIKEYRNNCSCAICGEKDPCVIDFHHLNGEDKSYTISQMRTYSLKTIEEELSKCIPLCANCHRKLHAGKLSL